MIPQTDPLADRLGRLRAGIKVLQDEAKAIEKKIIDSGATELNGDLFRVTVVVSKRENVDWKAIAAKLSPSRQLITAYTSRKNSIAVRVWGQKKEA